MHLSDRELIQALDGELAAGDAARVDAHLAQCWTCRVRQQEMEAAIATYVRLPQASLPPADGARGLLKAQIGQIREPAPRGWLLLAAAVGAVLVAGFWLGQQWRQPARLVVVAVPDPRLTPGATVLLSSGEVCRASNTKNKVVPVALRRKVFKEYGISYAEPRAYEVDYLITPALGGAEDIHNLWPQSYENTVWNAQVKDDLEDHLRALVCAGELDLSTAQREIAKNWIEAYKKYFHTDRPR